MTNTFNFLGDLSNTADPFTYNENDQSWLSSYVTLINVGGGRKLFNSNKDVSVVDLGNVVSAGTDGDDTLETNTGTAFFLPGTGNDFMKGRGGKADTVSYVGVDEALNIKLGKKAKAESFTDKVKNIENAAGGIQDDTIKGNGRKNVLFGDEGNDTLKGGQGVDVLIGGKGDDVLKGGNGFDFVSYSLPDATAGVSVDLDAGTATDSDGSTDTLKGIKGAIGTNFDDTLIAGKGKQILVALGGDDELRGGKGKDMLLGGLGNDIVEGGRGKDSMDGGEGFDVLDYSNSRSAVEVDLGAQTASGIRGQQGRKSDAKGDEIKNFEGVIGSSSDDILTGSDGDNLLVGGAGADQLDGAGNGAEGDTADYSKSADGVDVNLEAGTGAGGDAEGDTLSNIENLVGSDFRDTLRGDANANVLFGRAGDDTLNGGDGDDVLIGGSGADTLDGGADTSATGGDGDTVDYSASDATIGVEIDLASGTAKGGDAEGDVIINVENVIGSGGDDKLIGDENNNSLNGFTGNDTIHASLGDDEIIGGEGNGDVADYSVLNPAEVTEIKIIENADGSITVEKIFNDGVNPAVVVGTDQLQGIETIIDTFGDSFKPGGDGDDIFEGEAGDNVINGGDGNDTVDYSNIAVVDPLVDHIAVTVDPDTGNFIVEKQDLDGNVVSTDTLTSIENIIGTQGDDSMIGNDADNIFVGGAGADTFDGGDGNDTADYSDSAPDADTGEGVSVDLTLAGAQVSNGDASGDVLSNVENVIGTSGDDTITGDANDNVIAGLAGADVIDGGANGEAGDTVDYSASAPAEDGTGVTIDLGTVDADGFAAAAGGDAEGDKLIDIENVIGSAGNDTITGDAKDNVIAGLAGADIIDGAGNGINGDTVDYSASGEGVTIDLAAGTGLGGDAEGDQISNIENVIGSANDDVIKASADVDNTINGGDDVGGDAMDYSGLDQATEIDELVFTINDDGTLTVEKNFQGVLVSTDTLVGVEKVFDLDGKLKQFGANEDDTIIGDENDSSIDGGDGFDTVDYSALAGVATIDHIAVTADVDGVLTVEKQDAENLAVSTDTLQNIESVIGTLGNDSFVGNLDANTFAGLAGADSFDGAAGVDTVDYSASVEGVSIDLSAVDAEGFATGVGGDAAGDKLKDVENVTGSNGNDTITGNASDNLFELRKGKDTVTASLGSDIIDGGEGLEDSVDYSQLAGVSEIFVDFDEETGVITVEKYANENGKANGDEPIGVDTLTNIEKVVDLENVTREFGTAAADTLIGDATDSNIDAGSGTDTADYSALDDVDTIDHIAVTADVDGVLTVEKQDAGNLAVSTDTLKNVEKVIGTAGDDSFTGNDQDETFAGLGGADTFIGGEGNNTADYSASVEAVDVDLSVVDADGFATGVGGDAEGDKLRNVENIIGSSGDDIIGGNDGNNTLELGDGNDTALASLGIDAIDGGAGTDDTADYSSLNGTVVADINVIFNEDETITIQKLDADGNVIQIDGADAQDTLTGVENIVNLDGSTFEFGTNGADTYAGSLEPTSFEGGDGFDTADYSASQDITSIRTFDNGDGTSTVFKNDEPGGTDTLDSVEAIVGTENADDFFSGAGDQTLTSGNGADTFHFIGNDHGTDAITDFDTAEDVIEIIGASQAGLPIDSLDDLDFVPLQDGTLAITYGDLAEQTQIILENVTEADLQDGQIIFG